MSPSALIHPVHLLLSPIRRLRAMGRELVDLLKEFKSAMDVLGGVYVGQPNTPSGESTSGSIGGEARLGLSSTGSKIHIVRECSFNQAHFLCGQPVYIPVTEAFSLNKANLCRSCRALYIKGSR